MAKANKNEAATATVDAGAGEDAKRNNIAKKLYMRAADAKKAADAEGVQSRVFGEAEVVRFDFSNGETRVVNPDNFPDAVRVCFMLYGIAQKLGDAYALNAEEVATAAAEGKSKVEACVDAFDAMIENLASGWIAETKASGPRAGDVLEAWARVADEAGLSGDALVAKRAIIASALKSGDPKQGDGTPKAYREFVLSHAKVAAALAAIKAERATERAVAAAAKVGAGADDGGLFS